MKTQSKKGFKRKNNYALINQMMKSKNNFGQLIIDNVKNVIQND